LQRYADSRLIVRFKSSAPTGIVHATGLRPTERIPALEKLTTRRHANAIPIETRVYQITDGANVLDKIAELRSMPHVEIAEPDYKVDVFRLPTDPGFTRQWYLPKIGANLAWNEATGSKKVKICVIDSGVRVDHPDLVGNIETGWNVVHPDNQTAANPDDPSFQNFNDTLGHGTHVAGILAAMGNNGQGVVGLSWRVNLLICKFIADSGSGYVSDAINCMRLCREQGAHIYSNSWGGVDYQEALGVEIKAIQDAGGLFVSAAGNSAVNLDVTPSYPASYDAPNQLTVAASDAADGLADFSNFGVHSVHVAAPGVAILSTTAEGDYGYMSGTSMAAPVVAGAAALLQAVAMNQFDRTLTPMRLKRLIIQNVDRTTWGPTALVSGGRINIAKAMEAMVAELQGGPMSGPPPAAPKVRSPPPPRPPPRVRSPPPPSPPASTTYIPPSPLFEGAIVPPPCGTSLLNGRPATQSTNFGLQRHAVKAVNGDCFNDMKERPGTCAATNPESSFPWWTSSLKTPAEVLGVSLTTRKECCWGSIGGAIIYVGNTPWTHRKNATSFTECGRVPSSGISGGLRMTIKCTKPVVGSHVAVYLPKERTALVLCEVDVTLKDPSATPSPMPILPPPSPKTIYVPPSIKKSPPPKRKSSVSPQ
jgi:thermitase